MRVTFLTHYYRPETGAPQARISALAKGLARKGLDVNVHAPPPHYPDGRIRDGYPNRLLARDPQDDVPVWRSAVYPAPNTGFYRRLVDHASFGASAIFASARTPAADIVVAESPPLFLAGAAIAYARRKRARLVLNVSDLWPRSAIELGALRARPAIAAARELERRAYAAAAAIVCPTEGILAELDALPESSGKARWIRTGVDLDAFDPARPKHAAAFRVLYAGTTGMAQGVGTLLDAAALLVGSPRKVHVRIVGDGAEWADLRRGAEPLRNVTMPGPVPHEAVPKLLGETDAVVVLLRDRPILRGAIPTKLLEGLAAGRPVVLAAAGEAASLLEGSGGGVVVPPEDPRALAGALDRLAADAGLANALGARGRSFAEGELGLDHFVDTWLELLEGVSLRPGRAR